MAAEEARPAVGPDASFTDCAGLESVSTGNSGFQGAGTADGKAQMAVQSTDSSPCGLLQEFPVVAAESALTGASDVTSESLHIVQPVQETGTAEASAWLSQPQHLLTSPVAKASHDATCSVTDQSPLAPEKSHTAASGAQTAPRGAIASPGGQSKAFPSPAGASTSLSPQITGRKRRNPGPRPRPRQPPQLREGGPSAGPAAQSGGSGAACGVSVIGGPHSGAKIADVYDGPARLTTLPVDICLDILRFLSPEDLASCSRTCSYLRSIASDDRFWRRAYCLRWGQRPDDVEAGQQRQPRKQATWKQAYMQRDSADMEKFLEGVPQDMRPFYVHMQASKRSTAPTSQQAHAVSIRGEATLSEQISEWRRSRNFPAASSPAAGAKAGGNGHGNRGPSSEAQTPHETPSSSDAAALPRSQLSGPGGVSQGSSSPLTGAPGPAASREAGAGPCEEEMESHVCTGQHCTYHQIGNVFLCERTGKAHVCGDNCGATVVDPQTELLVCAVSGRCFDRIIDEREDKGDEGAGLNPNNEDDAEVMLGAGRLGAAFALGYDCEDEEALRQVQRLFGGA